MAPGVILSINFLAAVALTALSFVMERKEGLLERSLVAGVTSFQFLISHIFKLFNLSFNYFCFRLKIKFLYIKVFITTLSWKFL